MKYLFFFLSFVCFACSLTMHSPFQNDELPNEDIYTHIIAPGRYAINIQAEVKNSGKSNEILQVALSINKGQRFFRHNYHIGAQSIAAINDWFITIFNQDDIFTIEYSAPESISLISDNITVIEAGQNFAIKG